MFKSSEKVNSLINIDAAYSQQMGGVSTYVFNFIYFNDFL